MSTAPPRTIADAEQPNELALRLCEALNLDPNEVCEVYIEIQPGRGAAARWTSVRKVDFGRIVNALDPAGAPPCMATAPQIIPGVYAPSCNLPLDHRGGHRNADGTEWIERPAHVCGPDHDAGPAGP